MPNKILNQSNPKSNQSSGNAAITTNTNSNKSNGIYVKQLDGVANNAKQTKSHNKMTNQELPTQQQTNILNVAEMLLHGVADNEILTIWLQSIACQEFSSNFLDAGYDMPTISRITPQDLTAIGITDPAKRLKILSEIKKLNIQDGIPAFRPANLSHWLSLLRLDSQYHDLLCDQQIDTIEKMCQLTWEDFEELGITKLGHQKRLILAIERMKDIDSDEAKASSKSISEPIYDSTPSQILLVASAENHCMNGPIINKQSSTSELSSSGSGSMHSVYSANSMHHQATYATLPSIQQHPGQNQCDQLKTPSQVQTQQVNQPTPSQIIHKTPLQQPPSNQPQSQITHPSAFNQQNTNSHYQASQAISTAPHLINSIYDSSNLMKRNTMVSQPNRQSLGQLPLSALANLPLHQQQLLQQRSLYATLGRQPQRVKQPPPPVPIRTNSLKSNSLIDEEIIDQQTTTNHDPSQTLTNSVGSLFRSGTRIDGKSSMNSQTLLTKNKSFSGNAYMDAARARFLNKNNYYQQHPPSVTHQLQSSTNYNDQNGTNEFTYGIDTNFNRYHSATGHPTINGDNASVHSRQSVVTTISADRSNTFNLRSSDIQAMRAYQNYQRLHQQQQQHEKQQQLQQQQRQQLQHQQQLQQLQQQQQRYSASVATKSGLALVNGDEFDPHSDSHSTKSLILHPTTVTNSPVSSSRQMSLSQDSDSSQTLYNSASSGSHDRNLNDCNFSQSADLASRHSVASDSTLNDVNLILDQTVVHRQDNNMGEIKSPNLRAECNATTGQDDDFPPPPSPLSLTDSDENDLLSLNSDRNFADINNRLMAFRVGGI